MNNFVDNENIRSNNSITKGHLPIRNTIYKTHNRSIYAATLGFYTQI